MKPRKDKRKRRNWIKAKHNRKIINPQEFRQFRDGVTVEGIRCPDCDGTATTALRRHAFRYGPGESEVDVAELPVRVCNACGFEFLDEEGERLKHEAVRRHLDDDRDRRHSRQFQFFSIPGVI